ncbi:hypothetical protein QVM62_20900 [Pseudomonas putida]|uniref:hypothetical protein n=1 Tax=Pseudomonas TaxID=286 RepID=UPI003526472C
MKKIRDDGYLMGWEQGAVEMALSDEGLFVLSKQGGARCNLKISSAGVNLLVGTPQDLAVLLLSLTGEDPSRLLARFAAIAGAVRAS